MTLKDLIILTQEYSRDTQSYMFRKEQITMFLNQAIDRIKQFKMFGDIPHLTNETDEPALLPPEYHYILALFSSSRLFDIDERFYEGTQKRNEFEHIFQELTARIGEGSLGIPNKTIVDDFPWVEDFVVDKYFTTSGSSGGEDE